MLVRRRFTAMHWDHRPSTYRVDVRRPFFDTNIVQCVRQGAKESGAHPNVQWRRFTFFLAGVSFYNLLSGVGRNQSNPPNQQDDARPTVQHDCLTQEQYTQHGTNGHRASNVDGDELGCRYAHTADNEGSYFSHSDPCLSKAIEMKRISPPSGTFSRAFLLVSTYAGSNRPTYARCFNVNFCGITRKCNDTGEQCSSQKRSNKL